MEDQKCFSTSCGIEANTHDAIVDINVVFMNTEDGTVKTIPLNDDCLKNLYP